MDKSFFLVKKRSSISQALDISLDFRKEDRESKNSLVVANEFNSKVKAGFKESVNDFNLSATRARKAAKPSEGRS